MMEQSVQMRELDLNRSGRTDIPLSPSVITNNRVRRCFPVFGSRTIGPVS